MSRARVTTGREPQCRQHALISDFLDLDNLSVQEEAAVATDLIDDLPEGLTLQEPCVSPPWQGPVMSSSPKKSDCERAARH